MVIHLTFPQNQQAANCYLVISKEGVIVVDPGSKDPSIAKIIKEKYGDVIAVLITHDHYDHSKGASLLQTTFNCPVYVHKEDEEWLTNPKKYQKALFYMQIGEPLKDGLVTINDGDELKIGDFIFQVIHTPFHSKGSVCYLLKEYNILFTGDTLFNGMIGRVDLVTSEPKKINESLNKLKKLDPKLLIYPGHGDKPTILRHELETNPYLLM